MSKKLKPLVKLPEKMGKVADVVNNIIDHIKNGSGGGGKTYKFIEPLKVNSQDQVYIEGNVGKVYTGVRPIVVNNETNTISYDEHPTPPPAGSLHGSYVIKQGTNISEPSLLIEAGDGGFGKDDPYGETSIFSWLKLNSHAYVGKWNYETNKLDLWQLKDDDFTKFADGSDATDYITDDVEQGYNVFMKLPKFWYKDTVDIEDNVHFYAANYEIEGYNEWDDTQLFGVYEAYVDTNVADADRAAREVLVDVYVVRERELLRQKEEHELSHVEREQPEERLRDDLGVVEGERRVVHTSHRAAAKVFVAVRSRDAELQLVAVVERKADLPLADGRRLQREPAGRRGVVSALHLAALTAAVHRDEGVGDDPRSHVAVGTREHAHGYQVFGRKRGLLAQFAARPFVHGLVGTNEAARKSPASLEGPLSTLDEQHLECELGVLPPLPFA